MPRKKKEPNADEKKPHDRERIGSWGSKVCFTAVPVRSLSGANRTGSNCTV